MEGNVLSSEISKTRLLSKKEEKEIGQILYDLRAANKVKTKEYKNYRDKLVVSNLRVIYDVIKRKFKLSTIPVDELVSAGMPGLINAAETYDVSRGFSFSTYASACIKNSILNYIKREDKFRVNESTSIDNPINENGDTLSSTFEDEKSPDIDAFINIERRKEVLKRVLSENKITDLEKEILTLRFEKMLSLKEIAKQLDRPKNLIERTESRVLGKLRRRSPEYYNELEKVFEAKK